MANSQIKQARRKDLLLARDAVEQAAEILKDRVWDDRFESSDLSKEVCHEVEKLGCELMDYSTKLHLLAQKLVDNS